MIAWGGLQVSLGLLLNCSSCYKFYYSLSNIRAGLKRSLIIAWGSLKIVKHTPCGLDHFAGGGVWILNHQWAWTAHCRLNRLVNCEIQTGLEWTCLAGFSLAENGLKWLVVCCGFHLLFNCFLMGLLGSSQRCKILIERHLETPERFHSTTKPPQLFTTGHTHVQTCQRIFKHHVRGYKHKPIYRTHRQKST